MVPDMSRCIRNNILHSVLFCVATAGLPIAAHGEEYVYVLPNGRVQWGANVNAKRVALSELPPEQQQELLDRRQNTPTMATKLRRFDEKFTPVTDDAKASHVRVLLACDTAALNLGCGVATDLGRMEQYFEEAFRNQPGVCQTDKLTSPDLTADRIVEYYSKLQTVPSDTLVFYYSGHGKVTPLGQALAISDGSFVYRAKMIDEMQKRPHRCLIVVTDCCSSTTVLEKNEAANRRDRVKQILGDDLPIEMPQGVDPRTVEWLFRRHTGTIDLTAASPSRDQFSWSTNETGGFFTYSLVRVLRMDVNQINKGRRGRIEDQATWKMAFDRVQSGAALMSLGRRNAPPLDALMSAPPKDRDRIWQFAHAFSLH
jgi:hypothetical protein